MAIAVANVQTPGIISGPFPGFGYEALLCLTPDNSYDANGDVIDLSAWFPNEVYGGHPIHAVLNGSVVVGKYSRAALGAPATGVVQFYVTDTSAGDVAMVELAAGAGAEGLTSYFWAFYGR